MKANEFVKQHGFDGAYELWEGSFNLFENDLCILSGSVCRLSDSEPLFSLCDLKRLIESHELVKKMGGLNGAINSLSLLECSLAIGLYHGVVGVNTEAQISELKQAIADVESCL